ncbi:MAG: hypothetical protein ACKPKO_65270, partial [Candidatus Fonsibacter sp.]
IPGCHSQSAPWLKASRIPSLPNLVVSGAKGDLVVWVLLEHVVRQWGRPVLLCLALPLVVCPKGSY